MKSIITIVLVGVLTINISLKAENTNSAFSMGEEKFINDIPFNTESIYRSYLETEALYAAKIVLSDELNVNDIPFNTSAIVASELLSKSITDKKISAEPYIDDIPFNTGEIVANNNTGSLSTLVLKDEAFVNDIPFDTEKIAAASLKTEEWTAVKTKMPEDSYVDDIPFDTRSVASQYDNSIASSEEFNDNQSGMVYCDACKMLKIEIDEKSFDAIVNETRELINVINSRVSEHIASVKPVIEANLKQVLLTIDEERNTIQTLQIKQKCMNSRSNCCRYAYPEKNVESGVEIPEIRIVITKE